MILKILLVIDDFKPITCSFLWWIKSINTHHKKAGVWDLIISPFFIEFHISHDMCKMLCLSYNINLRPFFSFFWSFWTLIKQILSIVRLCFQKTHIFCRDEQIKWRKNGNLRFWWVAHVCFYMIKFLMNYNELSI